MIASLRDYRIVRKGDSYEVGPVQYLPDGAVPAAGPGSAADRQPGTDPQRVWGRSASRAWSGFSIGSAAGRPEGELMGDGERKLATGISPAVRSPRNALANAALARDPELRPRVTVNRVTRVEGPGVKGDPALTTDPSTFTTSADVLEALHRATGMTSSPTTTRGSSGRRKLSGHRPAALRGTQPPGGRDAHALAEGSGRGSHRPVRSESKTGDWLQFRTTSYFNDRLKEVPNRLLNRWAAAHRRNGALTMDELVEIAQLSDAQLDSGTMAEGARLLYGLVEWRLARDLRSNWRYLADYTPEQRRAAQSPAGLLFRQMSFAQQQRFMSHALGASSVHLDLLEELAEGGLQVDFLPPVGFQLAGRRPAAPAEHGLDAPRVWGQTRASALQAARRIDPNVTPAQIVPAEISVTFTYRLGGPNARLTPMIVHADTHNVIARRPQPVQPHGNPAPEAPSRCPVPNLPSEPSQPADNHMGSIASLARPATRMRAWWRPWDPRAGSPAGHGAGSPTGSVQALDRHSSHE